MRVLSFLAAAAVGCSPPQPQDPPAPEVEPQETATLPTTADTGSPLTPTGDTGTPPTEPLQRAYRKLSAGDQLTCALLTDGTVECRGSTPWRLGARPAGLFVDVAAAWDTACAIRDNGTLACWGCNRLSSLCNAPPGDQWVAVDGADSWFCALNQTGALACWGLPYGWSPRPGVAYTDFAVGITGPVAIRADDGQVDTAGEAGAPPGALVEIGAGRSAACGVRASDGGTECVSLDVPHPPDGLSLIDGYDADFCWLDAQSHAGCARRAPDAARDGFDPQTEAFADLTMGKNHACAVTTDGRGFCWPRDGRPETSGITEWP